MFFEEGLFVVLPLACFGILKRQIRYVIPLICFAIHLGVLSYLANMDTNRALMRGVYVELCCILCLSIHHSHEKNNTITHRYRRFWQQANVHVFTWCGDGFARVVRRRIPKHVQILTVLILILSQLAMNFESRDFHDSHHIRTYGNRVLNTLPENSILLVTEDLNNNAIKYVSVRARSARIFNPLTFLNVSIVSLKSQEYYHSNRKRKLLECRTQVRTGM